MSRGHFNENATPCNNLNMKNFKTTKYLFKNLDDQNDLGLGIDFMRIYDLK